MIDPFPPEHMDKHSRNERLYRHLLGMGLVVTPIRETDPLKIDYLYVSVALPMSEASAAAGVIKTVERSEVVDIVRSAKDLRDGEVVEFPSVER